MDQKKVWYPDTDLKRNTFNLALGMKLNDKISTDGNITYTALKLP
jgi:hypothetical protein